MHVKFGAGGAAYAKNAVNWPEDYGRALLYILLACATAPTLLYRNEWRHQNVVILDNQAILHRATLYDKTNY